MAKASNSSTDPAEQLRDDLARQLFASAWHPNGPINAETIAAQCFDAAEAFCRVAARPRPANQEQSTPQEK